MCQIQSGAPGAVLRALEAAPGMWTLEVKSSQSLARPDSTAFSPGSYLCIPHAALPSCRLNFSEAGSELTLCLENLCKTPPLGEVECKPKNCFACKRGTPGGPDQKEPRSESQKLEYRKTIERPSGARLGSPGRAGEAGHGEILCSGFGAGAEGALGTPL